MDYVSYSKKAFLDLKEIYKGNRFALYQPKDDENIVMYATRDGHVHVWHNDVAKQVVTISCVILFDPADICRDVFEELIKIAKKKHWRDGVRKLRYYLRHVGEDQLNKEGLDPYFYAWMVHYNVKLDNGNPIICTTNYFDSFDDILREYEFLKMSDLADEIGEDVDKLVEDYSENTISYEKFMAAIRKRHSRDERVRAFVNEELPNATDEVRETVTKGILEIFESGEGLSRH